VQSFFASAGTPHTFANLGDHDARLLITLTPAGFEPYFNRLAAGDSAEPQAIAVGPRIRASTEKQTGGFGKP
jgi:hypothetical protein